MAQSCQSPAWATPITAQWIRLALQPLPLHNQPPRGRASAKRRLDRQPIYQADRDGFAWFPDSSKKPHWSTGLLQPHHAMWITLHHGKFHGLPHPMCPTSGPKLRPC